ncbi:SLAP domain-containing protein [Companilactobacillus versmoldensis]|uniref:SLAP domain-containing protein n=1 Tax=Companilactobacillus versmoldensis TaxID=194326 RepID=UPI0002491A8C|nr:SLAP domain-containing protein [Companilactobacillus versmoldensis]
MKLTKLIVASAVALTLGAMATTPVYATADDNNVSVNNQYDSDGQYNGNYQVINGEVQTNSQTKLYNSNGQLASRSLAPDTYWIADRMIMNNEQQPALYRVSTNEWVKPSDVTFINPIGRSLVTARADANLYDSNGNVAGTLPAGISYITDQRKTVNGITMYRVSTDQWVKATDVNIGR